MFKGECIYQTEKLTSKFYRRWPSSTKRNFQETPCKGEESARTILYVVKRIVTIRGVKVIYEE